MSGNNVCIYAIATFLALATILFAPILLLWMLWDMTFALIFGIDFFDPIPWKAACALMPIAIGQGILLRFTWEKALSKMKKREEKSVKNK